jgi:hypothetical protein
VSGGLTPKQRSVAQKAMRAAPQANGHGLAKKKKDEVTLGTPVAYLASAYRSALSFHASPPNIP